MSHGGPERGVGDKVGGGRCPCRWTVAVAQHGVFELEWVEECDCTGVGVILSERDIGRLVTVKRIDRSWKMTTPSF